MSSTQNSSLQQSYESFKPEMESQETADAHLLLVHIPGFTRQEVGANYEAAYSRIRVFGEKTIENNKRKRFSAEHRIPEDCDADKLKGQFQEGGIITITMPKKPVSNIPPKESEPAQEQLEAAKQVTTSPPKSASEAEPEEEAEMKTGEKGVSEEKPKSEMESSQRI